MAAHKRLSYVHEAAISLKAGTDPGAVGAAVTRELCAAVEHDGLCRWPHNNAIDPSGDTASFRTLFIARNPTNRRCERASSRRFGPQISGL